MKKKSNQSQEDSVIVPLNNGKVIVRSVLQAEINLACSHIPPAKRWIKKARMVGDTLEADILVRQWPTDLEAYRLIDMSRAAEAANQLVRTGVVGSLNTFAQQLVKRKEILLGVSQVMCVSEQLSINLIDREMPTKPTKGKLSLSSIDIDHKHYPEDENQSLVQFEGSIPRFGVAFTGECSVSVWWKVYDPKHTPERRYLFSKDRPLYIPFGIVQYVDKGTLVPRKEKSTRRANRAPFSDASEINRALRPTNAHKADHEK